VASAVGRLASVPEASLREEGACQALALAVRLLAPREGAALGVEDVEGVLAPLFLEHVRHDSHDVREVRRLSRPQVGLVRGAGAASPPSVGPPPSGSAAPPTLRPSRLENANAPQVAAAALPPFLKRLAPERRAAFVPDALEALANDSHWNVRAACAPLLLRLASTAAGGLAEGERAAVRRGGRRALECRVGAAAVRAARRAALRRRVCGAGAPAARPPIAPPAAPPAPTQRPHRRPPPPPSEKPPGA
jgi:hypothetical protein